MTIHKCAFLLAVLFATIAHAQTVDGADYNFESGTQGWIPSGAAISGVLQTRERVWAGVGSLAVQFAATGPAVQQQVSVARPGALKGKTITFHVFLPAGAAIGSVEVFAQDQRRWHGNKQPISALTLGGWNTLSLKIPDKTPTLARLGVEFETTGAFKGAVFVDSVGWSEPVSSGTEDAGVADAGVADAGVADAGVAVLDAGTDSLNVNCPRVMPLGDSITEGVNGGYRNVLYTNLTGQGCGVDYVGSLWDQWARCVDKNHEGHPGWTIGDVNGSIAGWLGLYRPDYVLLMIGTNDIAWWTVKSGAEVAADQARLIDTMQAARPSSWIVVASIPPISSALIPPYDQDRAQLARDYNAAAKVLIDARIAAGQKIRWADVNSVLTLADLYDGVHPTEDAHAKIANVWTQALAGILVCTSQSPVCLP